MTEVCYYYKGEPRDASIPPETHCESDGKQIIKLFFILERAKFYKDMTSIPFGSDISEPGEMLRLGGDRYVVNSANGEVWRQD